MVETFLCVLHFKLIPLKKIWNNFLSGETETVHTIQHFFQVTHTIWVRSHFILEITPTNPDIVWVSCHWTTPAVYSFSLLSTVQASIVKPVI